MTLRDIFKNILKENQYIPEIDEPDDAEEATHGYRSNLIDKDDETGKLTWDVQQEPKLVKMAGQLRKYSQELKYFEMLPNDPHYDYLKSEAKSIITSLKNAEGKTRQLQKDLQTVNAFKRAQKGEL